MAINNPDNYCVILAGGKGKRLWPTSRENYPKQFIDFFGSGRTLLQQTYDRFLQVVPQENIFVCTNQNYADVVREQLPHLGENNLMAEPIFRSTAPSLAWTTHRIYHINPSANIIISPSDQAIQNEDAFVHNVLDGLQFVSQHDCVLTMGIKPTRPEPGYGYIQLGEAVGNDVFKVQSFTEKPEREFAQIFVDSGEFYWNTGLYLLNARYGYAQLSEKMPMVLSRYDEEQPNFSMEGENDFIRDNFPLYPNLSIEHAIIEKSDNSFIMKCNFGWADIGTWHSVYESMQKKEDDNVVIDSRVILEDCHNNVIKLSKDKLGIINGLEGYIVVEKDNILFICKKEDSSALVRKYVNEVQMKYGDDFV